MIIGFNSDLFLRRPMTGISNFRFEMVRAQQQLDANIDYLGFMGIGWKTVDAAYLAGIARNHGKCADDPSEQDSGPRLFSAGLQWLAQKASRVSVARHA